jgi:hypothetical protein
MIHPIEKEGYLLQPIVRFGGSLIHNKYFRNYTYLSYFPPLAWRINSIYPEQQGLSS